MTLDVRILLVTAFMLSVAACDSAKTNAPAASSHESHAASMSPAAGGATQSPDALVRVADVSLVCMVNDQFMGRPQIPVPVEGRTYYGCCENCKAKLANDATARTGKDPVTGESVDKSTAVIGQEPSGKVYYFASEANLAKFASTRQAL
jgi:YHS domain-containing protein